MRRRFSGDSIRVKARWANGALHREAALACPNMVIGASPICARHIFCADVFFLSARSMR